LAIEVKEVVNKTDMATSPVHHKKREMAKTTNGFGPQYKAKSDAGDLQIRQPNQNYIINNLNSVVANDSILETKSKMAITDKSKLTPTEK